MKTKKIHQNTTLDVLSSSLPKTYMTRLCGDGQILPIEERIGKKLLRTINPMSKKGKTLLSERKVIFNLPDGERISSQSLAQVFLKLRELTLEKMKKFPEDQQREEHLNAVIKNIKYWEKLYLD